MNYIKSIEHCENLFKCPPYFIHELYPNVPKNHCNVYYNLACCYGLLGNKEKSIENFVKSIELGYNLWNHISSDTDLDLIRNDKVVVDILENH